MEQPTEIQVSFGSGGNSDDYVGDGWSGAEQDYRWMIGLVSILKVPRLRSDCVTLLLNVSALTQPDSGKARQRLTILQGDRILEEVALEGNAWISVQIDGLSETNVVSLVHPDGLVPKNVFDGSMDTRELSVCVREMIAFDADDDCRWLLTPTTYRLGQVHQQLQSLEKHDWGAVAKRFTSLGQNCEVGMFQRHCGAEPIKLLRFTSIHQTRLIHGLRNRFAGICDPLKLNFRLDNGPIRKEYIGHNEIYGLDYHTFIYEGDLDIEALKAREVKRLQWLTNSFFEDLFESTSIFVIHRKTPPLSRSEAFAVWQFLLTFNRELILLWIAEANPDERAVVGACQVLARGFLKGYLERLAPEENVPLFSPEPWKMVCLSALEALGVVQGQTPIKTEGAEHKPAGDPPLLEKLAAPIEADPSMGSESIHFSNARRQGSPRLLERLFSWRRRLGA